MQYRELHRLLMREQIKGGRGGGGEGGAEAAS